MHRDTYLKNIVFSDEFWAGAEKLNYYILFPALLFSTLSTAKIDLQSLSAAIIAMLIVVLAVTAFLYILRMFWHIPPARFGVHVQSMVRFNTYIGLALVTSLFKSRNGNTGNFIGALHSTGKRNFGACSNL